MTTIIRKLAKLIKILLNNPPENKVVLPENKVPEQEPVVYKVTREEILMGRDKANPLSEEQEANLKDLLARIHIVREAYGKPLVVSSGYRPPSVNQAAGGATRSSHMSCQAVDFRDPNGEFSRWCLANMDIIRQAGLYLEDPRWTQRPDGKGGFSGWTHLQSRPTRANPFVPNSSQPLAPDFKP
jgi:hypothetical protein